MWIIFFFAALLAVIILFIHINLELNSLSKVVESLVSLIRKHYGID